MARSKRELATRGERRIRSKERATHRWSTWRRSRPAPAAAPVGPVKCWEQSAFWVSVVVAILLLAGVVMGIVGFCRYVQKQGDKRMDFFAAVSSRVCMTVGFPDWNRPLFDGWWGMTDEPDEPETTAILTETQPEAEESTVVDDHTETEETQAVETEIEFETESTSEETESSEETTEAWESQPPVMVGDRHVVVRDMSYGLRGWSYIENRTHWTTDATELSVGMLTGKTVLILSSHPHDAYRDGGSMEEMTQTFGSLLQTAGVTVVQLPVAGDSYAEAFLSAEDAIRYYTALVPDVGLILDLRRSGELTEDGGVLQTDGMWADGRCAQIRFIVDGDGADREMSFDVAMSLRKSLWNMETSLSRPVLVRHGTGLTVAAEGQTALVTVEIGALGNRLTEAERVLPLLAGAVADLVK